MKIGNRLNDIFKINETCQIKLKKIDDSLEVMEAPKTVKTSLNGVEQSNTFNIKKYLTYSKSDSNNVIEIEGKYGYEFGDLIYEFEKNGKVHRFGNTNDEKGIYFNNGNTIIIYFEKESMWDEETNETVTKDVNKHIVMIYTEEGELLDDENFKLKKINENGNKKESIVSILNPVVGEWKLKEVVDASGNDIPITNVYGSGVLISNKLTFKDNLEYINGIGVTGEGNEGR